MLPKSFFFSSLVMQIVVLHDMCTSVPKAGFVGFWACYSPSSPNRFSRYRNRRLTRTSGHRSWLFQQHYGLKIFHSFTLTLRMTGSRQSDSTWNVKSIRLEWSMQSERSDSHPAYHWREKSTSILVTTHCWNGIYQRMILSLADPALQIMSLTQNLIIWGLLADFFLAWEARFTDSLFHRRKKTAHHVGHCACTPIRNHIDCYINCF